MKIKKYITKIVNAVDPALTKLLDRNGTRGILVWFFQILSRCFKDKTNVIYYDKENKFYIHKNYRSSFYIDTVPKWSMSEGKIENYVKKLYCRYYHPAGGDVIVDVGAGNGMECLYFAKEIGESGKIHAIEAHPGTFKALELIKRLNKLDNMTVFNMAIAGQDGIVYISDKPAHQKNTILSSDKQAGKPVPSLTFDRFVQLNNIKKIDFLRINIEGAEKYLPEGMKGSIKIIGNVAVSCHDFLFTNSDNEIRNMFKYFLVQNNFKIWELNTGNVIRDSWIFAERKGN